MRSAVIVAAVLVLVLASCVCAEPFVSVWGQEGGASQATTSWYGNVGLITIPSAYTPPASAATIGAHWVDRDPDSTWVANLNFGVTKDLELGGTWLEVPDGDSQTVINAKYHFDVAKWIGDEGLPQLAVGGWDLSNEINRAWYVVASKDYALSPGDANSARISLHLGYGDNDLATGAFDGIFGGIEFSAFKYGLIQAEYDGEYFNADLRYNLINGVSLDVGILDDALGVGASYRSEF